MFKNFFSRKKVDVKPQPKTLQANEPVAVLDTLDQWVRKIENDTGKQLNQSLNKLVEKVSADEFTSRDVLQAFEGITAISLQLQFSPNDTSNVADDVLLEIVRSGFNANVRKIAASKITNADHIALLEKETKGKDKAVYRILHDKLNVQIAETKSQQQYRNKCDAVLTAMTKLSQSALDPM